MFRLISKIFVLSICFCPWSLSFFMFILFYFPYFVPKGIYSVSLLLVEGLPTKRLEPFSIMHSLWTGRLEKGLLLCVLLCWLMSKETFVNEKAHLSPDWHSSTPRQTMSDIKSQFPTWCHLCAKDKLQSHKQQLFFRNYAHSFNICS